MIMSDPNNSRNSTIKSTNDLLDYVEHFKSHLILLGTVLKITAEATAIETGPGDPTSKCLKILHHWLQVTPDPTWNKFCSALKRNNTFNRARSQIEKDHCKHRKVSNTVEPRPITDSTFSLKWIVIFLLIPAMVSCSSYVSASQHTACAQLPFCPNHYMWLTCRPWQYAYQHYWLHKQSVQVTTGRPPPTEGINEALADTNQPQSEPHIVPTQVPLPAKSPSPSSSPEEEFDVKDSQIETKAKLTTIDSSSLRNLTEDELNLLQQQVECHHVWMELGVTGVGKSCLGNFILGQSGAFPESELDAISETESASMKNTTFDDKKLCVIDTPGLGDTLRLGKHNSKAMDIAEDYSHLITELTKMMLMTKQGISAALIVITLNRIEGSGLEDLLTFLNIFGDYWNHSIVVVTHGNRLGLTEEARYKKFENTLHNRKCPSALKLLSEKSNNRFVIVEAKELQNDSAYRRRVVSKILGFSDTITRKHGRYQDNLQSIGNEALERAKLQLRHKFEDMESPEAKAAIFQSTFQHVREVVFKLVKIKLADGEDVDKLKEMAKVKEKELSDIRRLRDLLYKEFLEEQKRRREAEEEQRRLAEEKCQAEKRRKEAEEKQRRLTEEKRKAEEKQRIETEKREKAELDKQNAEKKFKAAQEALARERNRNRGGGGGGFLGKVLGGIGDALDGIFG